MAWWVTPYWFVAEDCAVWAHLREVFKSVSFSPLQQMDSATPSSPSLVSVLSLLACTAQVLAAAMLTHRYGGQSSKEDRWILLWLFYDVIVHLTLVWLIKTRLYVAFLFVYFSGPLLLLVICLQFMHHFFLVVSLSGRSFCLDVSGLFSFSLSVVHLLGRSICLHVSGWYGGDVWRSAGWTLWV